MIRACYNEPFNARSIAVISSHWPNYPLKINNVDEPSQYAPTFQPYLPRIRESTPNATMTNYAVLLDLVYPVSLSHARAPLLQTPSFCLYFFLKFCAILCPANSHPARLRPCPCGCDGGVDEL